MTIRVTNLATLDGAAVRQEDELLAEQLQEINTYLDMKQGVLRDYLAYFGGILATKNQVEQNRQRLSTSLNAILDDPTLADDEAVDNIASNYRVTRLAGGTAIGSASVIMSVLADFTLSAGTIFEALGQQFMTQSAFTARTSSAGVVGPDDRVLTPVGDGTYSFQIDLVAIEDGEAGRLTRGTLLVPTTIPLNFVKAYATEDFLGGLSAEDNQALLDRFVNGAAAKALSGRTDMDSALLAQTDFENVIASSIIGLGDREMLRDKHSIFPGSTGGRVDWYVRSQALYQTTAPTKTATLVEDTEDGFGVWQISFDRDQAAGLYTVDVLPLQSVTGSFEVTEDIRSIDNLALDSNDGFVPDLVDAAEAVYSRFQSVVIRFKDELTSITDLTVGSSTQDVTAVVKAMPLIADMQDYVAKRRVRNVMGDALLKAPVPCFVRLSFTIELSPGTADPDVSQIAIDLASLVNNYGFTGRLPASPLCDVVHNSLQDRSASTAIDIFGQIRRPDGTIRTLRSTEVLEVPDEPDRMVTARTVAFFLDPANVSISVITADMPEV